MMEKIIVLVAIILLTGVFHTLLYSNVLRNIGIGLCYFLGFYGLFTIYQSGYMPFKTENKRWSVLFTGFVCVLMAFFALEILLRVGA